MALCCCRAALQVSLCEFYGDVILFGMVVNCLGLQKNVVVSSKSLQKISDVRYNTHAGKKLRVFRFLFSGSRAIRAFKLQVAGMWRHRSRVAPEDDQNGCERAHTQEH